MTDDTQAYEALDPRLVRSRRDGRWESRFNEVRIALMLDWAAPRVRRLNELLAVGEDTDNPGYNKLLDELYNGLRDGLTRQDLLYIAVLGLTVQQDDAEISALAEAATQGREKLEAGWTADDIILEWTE